MNKFLKVLALILIMSIITVPTAIAKPQPELFWSYETGGVVNGVAISDEGNYTVAAASDGYLYFLNKSKKLMWKEQTKSRPLKVAISSDGSRIFAGDESMVYRYNKTGSRIWEFNEGNGIQDLATTQKGDLVAVGSLSYYVYLLDEGGNALWKYRTNAPVMSVAISEDGELISAGSARGGTYLLNKNGELLWEYQSGRSIEGVGILESRIASGNRYLNFLENGEKVGSSTNVVCDISSLETTADKKYMLMGCEDGKVHLLKSSKKKLWSYDVGKISWDSSISFKGDFAAIAGGKGVYILATPDITPPVVKITKPKDGASVSGTIAIDSMVEESSPYVLRVFIDGDFACSRLPCNWYTGAAQEGEHSITVEVNDSFGNVGEDTVSVTLKHTLLQNITAEISEKQKTVKETQEALKEKLNETVPRSLPPLREHRDYGPIIKAVLLVVAVYIAIRILRRPKTYKWKKGKGRRR